MIEFDEWHHLYDERWNGVITPKSMSHPAKYSRGLIRQIYKHAIEEGWLRTGKKVVVTQDILNEIICDLEEINNGSK